MKYEILHQDAFPIVKYQLEKGERIKAEADAMVAMSSTIDVTGGVEGGIRKGLTRMLSGEKFFFQHLFFHKIMEGFCQSAVEIHQHTDLHFVNIRTNLR